ncbi:MAG: glycosyltransferase family 2 protein [Betaproteobacteria bacterium]|nr:glycosyltransferase family 2 protein [Betaproteobacteria bacterium]MDE2123348.1 glycosyltransferase family 2 protein [Betaproteobacteria bacterium]MDE2187767.1 glycosyltransferase family 2 protein [Betaproteobacteria bacterium]MDE2323778.1 glycosyltransferase family 2 protein [Betaproteobacteria bacterium]
MFSILIPTWNNLPYLQLCIDSIRRYSCLEHDILVHVNDGSDGTLEWVRDQGIAHTHSTANVGICLAVNQLASMATRQWLVYLNDDMVCCPGWDAALIDAIDHQPHDLVYLSPTIIEPRSTVNPLTIVRDFGSTAETFNEAAMVEQFASDPRGDRLGQASPVSVVSKRWWHMVGGYSIEFSPGMGSEDDLMMKFWVAGCRHYAVIGDSRIYHFACRSTGRVRRNHGARTFVTKWGVTQGDFKRRSLLPSAIPQVPPQPMLEPTPTGRLKRAVYGLTGNFPLGDLSAWDAMPGQHLRAELIPATIPVDAN